MLPVYGLGWIAGLFYRVAYMAFLKGYIWADNAEIRRVLAKQGFSKEEIEKYITSLSLSYEPTDEELEEIEQETK
jgi:hypothetical protein